MRPLRIITMSLLLLVGSSLGGFAESHRPALHGSFLGPDLGDQWTVAQWKQEFGYMHKAGLKQVVLQWTADSLNKTTSYPTSLPGYTQNTTHDFVANALSAADKKGLKIYVGLQANDDWWNNYAANNSWLQSEAVTANLIADELWQKYGSHPSFAGWYLWFEVDNENEPTATEWERLVGFYQTIGTHLKALTPDKPIITSPFFNASGGLTPAQWQQMWTYIMARSPLDIVALQDGVGVGHATAAQLPAWFKATAKGIHKGSPKAQFWADTETFNLDSQPMSIRSIVTDMRAVQKYVSNYLSYSFNYYQSPQQVNPAYYKTYRDYLKDGTVETEEPTTPGGLAGKAIDDGMIQLNWTASTDNFGVVGYKIIRNGAVVATSYETAPTFIDTQLSPGTTYTYQVTAFDAAGNESSLSTATQVTTLASDPYITNLALGKAYVTNLPADANYPDRNGTSLTDGVYGAADYTDPAWQGRATSQSYLFTIDLGSEQAIKEFRSRWLQYEGAGIMLPQQVVYSVSKDGVNFTVAGTVTKPDIGGGNLAIWYTLTNLANLTGRYVKVQVTPPDVVWTFIDEIEVRQ